MYTAIVHQDGTFELKLHVHPSTLARDEARRSLRLFEEALEPLRRRAAKARGRESRDPSRPDPRPRVAATTS